MDLLGDLTRYIAPGLVAVLSFVFLLDLSPRFGRARTHRAARLIGSLLPALWLTSIGPQGLMEGGGALMRLLRVQPVSHGTVTLFGLAWLTIGIAALAATRVERYGPWFRYVMLGVGHAGIVSCIGVFVFLVLHSTGGAPANPGARQ